MWNRPAVEEFLCLKAFEYYSGDKEKILEELRIPFMEFVYFYAAEIRHDGENALDFTDKIMKRPWEAFNLYEPQKGSFLFFLTAFLKKKYDFFAEHLRSSRIKEYLKCLVAGRERAVTYTYESSFDIVFDTTAEYRVRNSFYNAGTLDERFKLGLLAMAVRTARQIDQELIEDIAYCVEMPVNYLCAIFEQAKDLCSKREEEIALHEMRRDYYFSRLAILEQKKNFTGLSENEGRVLNGIIRKKHYHSRKLTLNCYIPEDIVADVLGIRYMRVRALICEAKRRLKKMFD